MKKKGKGRKINKKNTKIEQSSIPVVPQSTKPPSD